MNAVGLWFDIRVSIPFRRLQWTLNTILRTPAPERVAKLRDIQYAVPDRLQVQLAETIAQLPLADAWPLLNHLLANHRMAVIALRGLDRFPAEDASPVIAARLSHYGVDARRVAVEILSRRGWTPQTLEQQVVWALLTGDFAALSGLGCDASSIALRAQHLVGSENREKFADALAAFGDAVLPSLERALRERYPDYALCVRVLETIASPDAIDFLMRKELHPHHSRDTLGRLGAEALHRVSAAFEAATGSPNDAHRAGEWAETLAAFGQPGLEILARSLQSELPSRRLQAACVLGRRGDRRALPILIEALATKSWYSALQSLAYLCDPEALPAILALARQNEHTDEAETIGNALDRYVSGLDMLVISDGDLERLRVYPDLTVQRWQGWADYWDETISYASIRDKASAEARRRAPGEIQSS